MTVKNNSHDSPFFYFLSEFFKDYSSVKQILGMVVGDNGDQNDGYDQGISSSMLSLQKRC
jgi:hypothetical protein